MRESRQGARHLGARRPGSAAIGPSWVPQPLHGHRQRSATAAWARCIKPATPSSTGMWRWWCGGPRCN